MSLQQFQEANPAKRGGDNPESLQPVNPADVLAELCELLEDFSPHWYTEEHHDRALAALRDLREACGQARSN